MPQDQWQMMTAHSIVSKVIQVLKSHLHKDEFFWNFYICRTSTTLIAQSGASGQLVKIFGDWKHIECAQEYVDKSQISKVKLANFMSSELDEAGMNIEFKIECKTKFHNVALCKCTRMQRYEIVLCMKVDIHYRLVIILHIIILIFHQK